MKGGGGSLQGDEGGRVSSPGDAFTEAREEGFNRGFGAGLEGAVSVVFSCVGVLLEESSKSFQSLFNHFL